MGKVAAVASNVLFLVALANAEVPSGNAFIGYSHYNGTNLSSTLFGRATTNGWEASIEGKILPFVGLVADFDGISAQRPSRPVVRDVALLGVLSRSTTTCSVLAFPCRWRRSVLSPKC
jgi:hypothetical protein